MTWNAYNTTTQSKQQFVSNLAESAIIWYLTDYAVKIKCSLNRFYWRFYFKATVKKVVLELNDFCDVFMDMFLF